MTFSSLPLDVTTWIRSCIHRLFPCGVCPCSLVTRHTDNEPLFCLVGTTYGYSHKAKQRVIICVARHKGTRTHATSEQSMDARPYIASCYISASTSGLQTCTRKLQNSGITFISKTYYFTNFSFTLINDCLLQFDQRWTSSLLKLFFLILVEFDKDCLHISARLESLHDLPEDDGQSDQQYQRGCFYAYFRLY